MRPLYSSSAMGTIPKVVWEAALLHHQRTEAGPARVEAQPQQQHHLPRHAQHEALLFGCSFWAPHRQGKPVGGLLPQRERERESSECWSPQACPTSAWAQGEAKQCQQGAWISAVTSVSLQHPAQQSQENRDIPWLQHAMAHPRVTTEQNCSLSECRFMRLQGHAGRALPQ